MRFIKIGIYLNVYEWLGFLFVSIGIFLIILALYLQIDYYLLFAGLIDLLVGGGIYAYGTRNRPEAVRGTPLSPPEK
ncbi:MAG: hypothetical protein QXT63_05605 [Thermoplasmata archaeon]